ncbi:hypothetical protein SMKC032_35980 [Serratia marcescens]|nr:hypothetical protein SMKC032_35980 [Serratia marcescens]
MRNSLRFVSWKDDKAVTRDLKTLSGSNRISWLTGAGSVLQCLGLPLPTDKSQLAVKLDQCGHVLRLSGTPSRKRKGFPKNDSVKKVVWLAFQAASQKRTMPRGDWRMAVSRFIIEFGDRLDGHFREKAFTQNAVQARQIKPSNHYLPSEMSLYPPALLPYAPFSLSHKYLLCLGFR